MGRCDPDWIFPIFIVLWLAFVFAMGTIIYIRSTVRFLIKEKAPHLYQDWAGKTASQKYPASTWTWKFYHQFRKALQSGKLDPILGRKATYYRYSLFILSGSSVFSILLFIYTLNCFYK